MKRFMPPLTLLFLLFAGCSSTQPASSGFPIVELTYRDRTEKVNLRSDYGYIVHWVGVEGRKPVFYVFDRKRRSRIKTDRWERFIQELKSLPDGIEIDAVGKCSAPFAWGMPESNRKELQQVLEKKSIREIDVEDVTKHVLFCYCEAGDFRVLYDKER